MDLERRLAEALLAHHPIEAARVLETLDADAASSVMTATPPRIAARVLRRATPHLAAAILERTTPERAAALLAEISLDVTANLMRKLDQKARTAILEALEPETAQALRNLLRYPEGTAASIMGPLIVALPDDLTAEEALSQLRRTPEHALYNLYVVDRDHLLVGVLNLRELLLAAPKERLSSIMHPVLYKVPADADRYSVVSNPGWREVHSLPVVDHSGHFLGALRYRTFKRLEDELRGEETDAVTPTVAALGDLFRAGIAGLVDALASTVPAPETRKD